MTGHGQDQTMESLRLIKQVFQELEKNNIIYCVLRNYDFLSEERRPSTASEQSLDLCVSQRDLERFEQVLFQLQFEKRPPQFSRQHRAFFRIERLQPVSFDVQVGGVYWNDMCYLPEHKILGQRVKNNFFYIPSDHDTVAMLILHSILGKRRLKPEYQEKISTLWNKIDKNYVFTVIQEALSAASAREILSFIERKDFAALLSKKNKYIAQFIAPPKRVAIFLPLLFRWLRGKKFWKAEPLISIIGTDGSGKSTLVSSLQEYLQRYNTKVAVVYAGRGKKQMLPRVIRDAGYNYKKKERQRDRQAPDRRAPPNLFWRRILYIFYSPVFMIDLGLRYLLLIFPKRRTKHVVITDRYCTDIWLMRYLPLFLRKFYIALFPRPNLTFYLFNSPEVLQQRRPLEKKEEFEYQLKRFKELGEYLPFQTLQTTDPKKDQEIVLKTVMAFLYRGQW